MPDGMMSGNERLDFAIENLLGVDAGDHVNSSRFSAMELSLRRLAETIRNAGEKPKLGSGDLEDLKRRYKDAIKKCGDYTFWKWTGRYSGYGKGRYNLTIELRKILEKDLAALQTVKAEDEKPLSSVFFMSRSQDVVLEAEDKDLKTVGANSSIRLPVEIRTGVGSERGFFTEDYVIRTPGQLVLDLENRYLGRLPGIKWFTSGMKSAHHGSITVDVGKTNNLDNLLDEMDEFIKQNDWTYDDLVRDENIFKQVTNTLFNRFLPYEWRVRFQQSLDALGQQGRQDFVDFLRDYHGEYLHLRVAGTGRMQQGGNIPDRNVAMSRMADMLGMKGLIAKSRKVRIKHKDGTVRSGVFQEAEEFSDAARLKAGDPIYELKNHRETLNDGNLLRQIADLQVLDYVCGNNDRHLGNIMYNVQMENGVPKIVSIKGIDNDRSMGMVDDHDAGLRGYITPPDKMKVISKSTLDALNALGALGQAQIEVVMRDLGISRPEIGALRTRVQDVLREVERGTIRIVEDDRFNSLRIDDLSVTYTVQKNGKWEDRYNLFSMIQALPDSLDPPVQDDKAIHYNAASAAAEPDYLRADRGQMYVSDFSTHKQELSQMLDSLKRTESIAHWNSASYDWMRDSLKNVIAGIKAMENKYTDADIPLQQEDAAKIEVLFRQMRLAAAKYVAEHRNPGYSRGITRKTCAESLAGKWPLRLGRPEPEVREVGVDQIAGNGVAHAPAKKSLSTALREARRAAGAPAAEVPGVNGAGGNAQIAAEQPLKRSVKHRRKVKISEAGEGPEDLMNSF